MEKQTKQLRVWHNSNFGHAPFITSVANLKEAIAVLNLLADYDLYQGDKIMANAQGLEVYELDSWTEWESETGADITECMNLLETLNEDI